MPRCFIQWPYICFPGIIMLLQTVLNQFNICIRGFLGKKELWLKENILTKVFLYGQLHSDTNTAPYNLTFLMMGLCAELWKAPAWRANIAVKLSRVVSFFHPRGSCISTLWLHKLYTLGARWVRFLFLQCRSNSPACSGSTIEHRRVTGSQ